MATSRYKKNPRLKKILVANRGEIAIRIMRSIRKCGFSPVAVFSEADRSALHLRFADEAYSIGPAPAAQSYLAIPNILDAAKKAGALAIHPGYGFLAENASFAKACEEAEITFIGPRSTTIATMGDKIEARKIAQRVRVPMTPASDPVTSLAVAKASAKKLGYPVLIKAKAGGGGKGMRQVQSDSDMESAIRLAQSEAQKAFKDDTLYLEKYVVSPRHVELQIFADKKGNVVVIGDRECSIQRRHQKIIEEAPAPHLSKTTRAKMAQAAYKIAKAVGYVGAGTVEFLVDHNEKFYFLEVNTRLQVEHPVTEWVTGYDLVEQQIRVAFNERLPFKQKDIALRGHSIEARIYAEDPDNHFFPAPGKLSRVRWPSGPFVRVDSGVESGSEVSIFYDPLLAKISVYGETREEACIRLSQALAEVDVCGTKTNTPFLSAIASHPRFKAGELSTAFIREEGPFALAPLSFEEEAAALAAAALSMKPRSPDKPLSVISPWWISGRPGPLFGRSQ